MSDKTSSYLNQPIGLFDSGAGGLFVLNHLIKALPNEHFIYLADTAHFPYGEKDAATIESLALRWGQHLENRGCKTLLIACNTAAAYALPLLQERLSIQVTGPILSAVAEAHSLTKNGKVGLLATHATIRSGIYQTLLKKLNLDIFPIESPLLAYLVQEGQLKDGRLEEAIDHYVKPLIEQHIDTLILGCTHYPYIEPLLKDYPFLVVDSSKSFIPSFVQGLTPHQGEGSLEFEITGDRTKFEETLPLYLPHLFAIK